jgi:hypothetical protein
VVCRTRAGVAHQISRVSASLTVSQAVQWCAGAISQREAARLRQLTGQAHNNDYVGVCLRAKKILGTVREVRPSKRGRDLVVKKFARASATRGSKRGRDLVVKKFARASATRGAIAASGGRSSTYRSERC